MPIGTSMGRIRVGTSGFSYPHWRRIFYPDKLSQKNWLAFYANVFDSVELNNTFYRLPNPRAVATWAREVPRGFRFAVKGSRYLTHMRKLLERDVGVRRFFDAIAPLEHERGPVLWQLPHNFHVDVARLDAFLAALPKGPHALEVRHESWLCDDVFRVLERRRATLVVHDALDVDWPWPPPGPFVYWRFHGTTGRYSGRYGRARLRRVARRLESLDRDAWVFFNNDLGGHALVDALDLLDLVGRPLARERAETLPVLADGR